MSIVVEFLYINTRTRHLRVIDGSSSAKFQSQKKTQRNFFYDTINLGQMPSITWQLLIISRSSSSSSDAQMKINILTKKAIGIKVNELDREKKINNLIFKVKKSKDF